jgi:hypothetical protein
VHDYALPLCLGSLVSDLLASPYFTVDFLYAEFVKGFLWTFRCEFLCCLYFGALSRNPKKSQGLNALAIRITFDLWRTVEGKTLRCQPLRREVL